MFNFLRKREKKEYSELAKKVRTEGDAQKFRKKYGIAEAGSKDFNAFHVSDNADPHLKIVAKKFEKQYHAMSRQEAQQRRAARRDNCQVHANTASHTPLRSRRADTILGQPSSSRSVTHRSSPSPQDEIRNPFSDDADDVSTPCSSQSSTGSFEDTRMPVLKNLRTVPAHTPVITCPQPLRAQIFYVVDEHMPDDADVISDPFACDSDASSSTLPGEQEDLEFRPDDRDGWKSRSRSTADSIDKPVDFLQVKIPSSVMTPVSQRRNTLWARK